MSFWLSCDADRLNAHDVEQLLTAYRFLLRQRLGPAADAMQQQQQQQQAPSQASEADTGLAHEPERADDDAADSGSFGDPEDQHEDEPADDGPASSVSAADAVATGGDGMSPAVVDNTDLDAEEDGFECVSSEGEDDSGAADHLPQLSIVDA